MKDQDSIFFKNFSFLLAGLVVLTIVLAVVGYVMHNNILGNDDMAKDRSAIAKTIEPMAKVNTGDAIIAVAEEKVEAPAAFNGSVDGKMIYDNVCFACHGTGAGGAPKLEPAAWTSRLSKGLDGLVENAITGFQGTLGFMPAKGGRADLSDEQLKAAVEYMINGL